MGLDARFSTGHPVLTSPALSLQLSLAELTPDGHPARIILSLILSLQVAGTHGEQRIKQKVLKDKRSVPLTHEGRGDLPPTVTSVHSGHSLSLDNPSL